MLQLSELTLERARDCRKACFLLGLSSHLRLVTCPSPPSVRHYHASRDSHPRLIGTPLYLPALALTPGFENRAPIPQNWTSWGGWADPVSSWGDVKNTSASSSCCRGRAFHACQGPIESPSLRGQSPLLRFVFEIAGWNWKKARSIKNTYIYKTES